MKTLCVKCMGFNWLSITSCQLVVVMKFYIRSWLPKKSNLLYKFTFYACNVIFAFSLWLLGILRPLVTWSLSFREMYEKMNPLYCAHLLRTPPRRDAFRHSGGERRLWTSPTVTFSPKHKYMCYCWLSQAWVKYNFLGKKQSQTRP